MFTGIVEEIGTVTAVTPGADSARLTLRAPRVAAEARPGASIAVDGVCLTVVDPDPDAGTFAVDVMGETLRRATTGRLVAGSRVNCERAMTADARLDGHLVQGHVDGVGEVLARTAHEAWETVRFSLPAALAPLVAEKGSITVAGTSLTVTAVSEAAADEPWFEVGLIPTTLAETTLGSLAPGAPVNLEADVVARHLQRLAAFAVAETPKEAAHE